MNAAAAGERPSVPARFIDPRVLARIANLDLLSRRVVDGFLSGLHRAAWFGASTEFAEHRAYVPGDDPRHIDWRVYGRTDRFYVRTYEAESNADLVLAVDATASMGFASAGTSKLDYARWLAASLAHLGTRQRDRVGLAVLGERVERYLPPSARQREPLMHALARTAAAGGGDLAGALDALSARLVRRGMVVVVSDFYLDPRAATAALSGLSVRGHDVIAFHLLDPAERDLGLTGPTVLEDMETGARTPVTPAGRDAYRAALEAHVDALARGCRAQRVDHVVIDTDQPLDAALFHYLSERARLARVR